MPIRCDRFDLKPYAVTIREEPYQIKLRQIMISNVDRNVSHAHHSPPSESEVDAMMNGRSSTPPGTSGPRTRESPALGARRRAANGLDLDTVRFGMARHILAASALPRPSGFLAREPEQAAVRAYPVPQRVAPVPVQTPVTLQPIIVHVPASAPARSAPLCICNPGCARERPSLATSMAFVAGTALTLYGAYNLLTFARFF